MNQRERDKAAIRLALATNKATSQEIALRGGEGLYPTLREMIKSGEVERVQDHSRAPIYYWLKEIC